MSKIFKDYPWYIKQCQRSTVPRMRKRYINYIKKLQKRWDFCQICDPEGPQMNIHKIWHCHMGSPKVWRKRALEKKICIACLNPEHLHKDGCSLKRILYHNKSGTKDGTCCRCGSQYHVFWTCEGDSHSTQHPGSQFKTEKNYGNDILGNKSMLHNAKLIDHIQKVMIEIKSMKQSIETENHLKAGNIQMGYKTSIQETDNNIKELELKVNEQNILIEIQKEQINKLILENLALRDKPNQKDESKCHIKELESNLLKKDLLIKTQKEQIDKLILENLTSVQPNHHKHQSQVITDQNTPTMKENTSDSEIEINQQDFEVLIHLVTKAYPEMAEIDSNLNNSTVAEILEHLIEKKEKINQKQSEELEIARKKLVKSEEIDKRKSLEIEELKRNLEVYESEDMNFKKMYNRLNRTFKREQSEKETTINALTCELGEARSDLITSEIKYELIQKQVDNLERKNDELMKAMKIVEHREGELDAIITSHNDKLSKYQDLEETINKKDNSVEGWSDIITEEFEGKGHSVEDSNSDEFQEDNIEKCHYPECGIKDLQPDGDASPETCDQRRVECVNMRWGCSAWCHLQCADYSHIMYGDMEPWMCFPCAVTFNTNNAEEDDFYASEAEEENLEIDNPTLEFREQVARKESEQSGVDEQEETLNYMALDDGWNM